jgi:hypothetical protein
VVFKRGTLGAIQYLHGADTASVDALYLDANDKLCFDVAGTNRLISTQVFRDPTAHGILLWSFDAANGTAANKLRIFHSGNGGGTFAEITAWVTDTRSGITTGTAKTMHNSIVHVIGKNPAAANGWLDAYLSDHRIGTWTGTPPTPASFGGIHAITGQWAPSGGSAALGTSGSYLPFSDATSPTTLCYDASGNGNHWTPNNISTTAGATYDSMLDVPLGGGGAERGNYCTLNPIGVWSQPASTVLNGNLTASSLPGNHDVTGTVAVSSGKWYFEALYSSAPSTNGGIGVNTPSFANGTGDATGFAARYGFSGTVASSGASSGAGSFAGYTTGDVIGVALDCDAGTVAFYKNNTLITTVTNTGAFQNKLVTAWSYTYSGAQAWNFGQRPFAFTPPAGFKALHTGNLPTPTGAALEPKKHFDVVGYVANVPSGKTISGLGFQPELVWIKNRDNIESHYLQDSVRGFGGAGTTKMLSSNLTSAEYSVGADVTFSTTADGFTIADANYNAGELYYNGRTYVAWNWKAGGAAVTNNAGSISSQVSANVAAGFSVLTYTGNQTSGATVGHGLGSAPELIIVKPRTGPSAWIVYHSAIGNTNFLQLHLTNASAASAAMWNNTTPGSSVFTLGNDATANANAAPIVAYCFRSISGFSKIGLYTGNGSADGPMVWCGFRPRYLMVKRSDSTSDWWVIDAVRGTYNPAIYTLYPNGAYVEDSSTFPVDFTANGFKVRTSNATFNGGTLIFYAISEASFKYALGR